MTERRSYAVTAAVWLGALVVVGLPTIAGVSAAGRALSRLVAGGEPTGVAALALAFVALALGVVAADVTTRIRLHGWSELQRGSPRRRLARHALLAVPVLAVLLLLFATVVELATFVAADGFDSPAVAVLAGAGLLAAAVVVRTALAFRDGRRETREASRVAEGVFGQFRK